MLLPLLLHHLPATAGVPTAGHNRPKRATVLPAHMSAQQHSIYIDAEGHTIQQPDLVVWVLGLQQNSQSHMYKRPRLFFRRSIAVRTAYASIMIPHLSIHQLRPHEGDDILQRPVAISQLLWGGNIRATQTEGFTCQHYEVALQSATQMHHDPADAAPPAGSAAEQLVPKLVQPLEHSSAYLM